MKFKKNFIIILFTFLFAILLGVYAQKIASFFGDNLYMIVLVITTIISIGLFAVAIVLEFMILISGEIKSRVFSMILTVVLLITIIIGLYVSWWSLFIMAMSFG
ncbi:hypothetical protein [Oceanobacillus sp. FSL H7-0719]|uniref:hypothetical protein n=1 Tax=Oceanobacillus sp. FSL H7-0719 TaxID=2954507 RepID=UPI0032464C00